MKRKKLYLVVSTIIFFVLSDYSYVFGQSSFANQNKIDSNNNIVYNGYDTSEVFKGNVLKNVVYTTALNYRGEQEPLALDIYIPANAQEKKFPVAILMHGGGFTGGNKGNLASTCSKLANNGYVAISVNYRLGWGFVSRRSASCNDTSLLKQAIYRAVQDVHSAINFIVQHADDYNIDTSWLFLGGQSAGAVTALLTAYATQKNSTDFFPGFSNDLGDLDKKNEVSNNNYKLKGVISMWGAFINPELITAQTALPTIFFQGIKDKAVPFYSRSFTPCANTSIVYGTYPLFNRLKNLSQTTVAHVDPEGGHGVFTENFRIFNILCFLNDVRQDITKQLYLTGAQNNCDK